jgi:hypothetical protein
MPNNFTGFRKRRQEEILEKGSAPARGAKPLSNKIPPSLAKGRGIEGDRLK